MLHEFIEMNRDELIKRCRAKVATRSFPPPTEAEIDHGVPMFLDQLVTVLGNTVLGNVTSAADPEMSKSAVLHGQELQLQGFTVSQVVHDYGDVCQSITELALEQNAPISIEDFRTLNRCLDDAIANAVTEFTRGQAVTRDGKAAIVNERRTFATRELRNLTQTAIAAFEALREGRVGVTGSTGDLLWRSLVATRDMLEQPIVGDTQTLPPSASKP
jgi:hypothetical protein